MISFANLEVLFLNVLYPENIVVMTSTVQGFFYNPSEAMGFQSNGLYFATMY